MNASKLPRGLCRKGFPSDIPFEVYRQTSGLNSHGAKEMLNSPADYLWQTQHDHDSPAKAEGRAFHTLALEPWDFERLYAVKKKVDGRTKEGRLYNEQFAASAKPGQSIVDEDEVADVKRWVKAMLEDEHAGRILNVARTDAFTTETSFAWDVDTDLGPVGLKARTDFIDIESRIVVDIKTATEISQHAINTAVRNYGYYLQDWWYRHALAASLKCDADDVRMLFIFVGKAPPNHVQIVELDKDYRRYADTQAHAAINRLSECLFYNNWPKRPSDVRLVSPPSWVGQE